jgi:hypothetical protein
MEDIPMQQQSRTIRLPNSKPNDDQEERPVVKRSDQVTVIAPGRGTDVDPGRSVRETLAEAEIFPTPQQMIRVGREEIDDLERVLRPGDIVSVVNKVKAG